MKFNELGQAIKNIHHAFSKQAGRSVNTALTIRNWMIGCYIKEYEQNGRDRAKYGASVLYKLAETLQAANISSTTYTSLKQYRQFYENYPEILQAACEQFELLSIGQTVSGQFNALPICQTPSVKFKNLNKSKAKDIPRLPTVKLIHNLSYSHFVQLMKLENPLKRSFYEIESIRSHWSSKELRRQISTLYYERLGLSKNKDKIAQMIDTGTYAHDIKDVIREPYMFEFVGVKHEDINEATLASTLLKQLNSFFLEMGRGFCFESSNKKILIGDQFYFIDLVLYHRILKCHFLIELKINELNHSDISQLNTYVSYFKKNEMHTDDNPPVGLLLCAEKNEVLAEYALDGMDNQLFISKYQLALPTQSELIDFIKKQLKELPNRNKAEFAPYQ